MKAVITLSTVLCVSGSGVHVKYNESYYDIPLEFIDAGLSEIAQEEWRGQGVVRRRLFFLQMHMQHLLGPFINQFPDPFVFGVLTILLAACFKLWVKASDPGHWWYKDNKGVVHGPFSTACMKHWRATGYLCDELQIKYAANATFAPLCELFPAPAVPFQSPPTPPGTPCNPVLSKEELKFFEEEVSADMLHAQHEAFDKHVQDLEDEMIMTLEAELEESVQSDDGGQPTISKFEIKAEESIQSGDGGDGGQPAISKRKNKESWNSMLNPLAVDKEEFDQICGWRAKRQLQRRKMAQLQLQMSRYNTDRTVSRTKKSVMKRNSSEERIHKQLIARCCNELTSEHDAALDEGLLSLIQSQ